MKEIADRMKVGEVPKVMMLDLKMGTKDILLVQHDEVVVCPTEDDAREIFSELKLPSLTAHQKP